MSTQREVLHAALGPRAARLLPRGQDVDGYINAALERYSVEELARYVGGTDHGLRLTPGRIYWRLLRAAGYDEESTD